MNNINHLDVIGTFFTSFLYTTPSLRYIVYRGGRVLCKSYHVGVHEALGETYSL